MIIWFIQYHINYNKWDIYFIMEEEDFHYEVPSDDSIAIIPKPIEEDLRLNNN